MNIGGVQSATIVDCPRCTRKALIPAGAILRVPAQDPDTTVAQEPSWCHETVDPRTGQTIKRAEPV